MIKFKTLVAVGLLLITAATSAWAGVQMASDAKPRELQTGRQQAPIGCD